MKNILLLTLCLGLFLVPAVAQTNRAASPDTVPADAGKLKPRIFIHLPAPKEVQPQRPNEVRPQRPDPQVYMQVPDSVRQQLLARKKSPFDNMPILGSSEPYRSRMPVYKPDTTRIDYKLKIKRLGKNYPYHPMP